MERKKREIGERKQQVNLSILEKSPAFKRPALSLKDFLLDKTRTGIIAEFKRRSPSKGTINDSAAIQEVTAAYVQYGASAVSVLTDEYFFGGSLDDLAEARHNHIPLLRKDFIVDEYQLVESKAAGADVILLIAACLDRHKANALASLARGLGLNVLLEVHNEEELEYCCDNVDAVGVNNRDLKTFIVDMDHSIALSSKIPAGMLKIAESGIDDPATIKLLKRHGFNGFLIGEKFMKEIQPGEAFKRFVSEL